MTTETQRAVKREEYETYKSTGSALREWVQEPVVREECKKITQKAETGKDRKRCELNTSFYKLGM